jgi:hypothetical protein
VIGKRECSSAAPPLVTDPFTCAVYANSFLASLNSRSALRGRSLRSRNDGTSFHVNTINLSGLGSPGLSSSEADSSTDAQNKTSNAHGRARVKTSPVDDLEVCS